MKKYYKVIYKKNGNILAYPEGTIHRGVLFKVLSSYNGHVYDLLYSNSRGYNLDINLKHLHTPSIVLPLTEIEIIFYGYSLDNIVPSMKDYYEKI